MNRLPSDSLRVIIANLDGFRSWGCFAQTCNFTPETKKDLQWRKLKALEDAIPLFMAYERIHQLRERDPEKEEVNINTQLHRVVLLPGGSEKVCGDCVSLERLLCMTQKEKTDITKRILKHFEEKENPVKFYKLYPMGLEHNAFELLVGLDEEFLQAAMTIRRQTTNDSSRLIMQHHMSRMYRYTRALCSFKLLSHRKHKFLYEIYMPTIMLEVCRLKDDALEKSQMKKTLMHAFKIFDKMKLYVQFSNPSFEVKTVADVWESCMTTTTISGGKRWHATYETTVQ